MSLIVVLVIGVIDAVVIACFWDLTIEVAKQKFRYALRLLTGFDGSKCNFVMSRLVSDFLCPFL